MIRAFLSLPLWARTTAAMVAAFMVASFIIQVSRATTGVAVFWPLNGLFLGICFLVAPQRAIAYLAALFCGTTLASLVNGDSWAVSVGLNLANIMEIVGAWLPLRMAVGEHRNIGHPRVLAYFTFFAVLLAPILSGSIAALALELAAGAPYWQTFLTWTPSNALGMTVFAPMAVAFRPSAWNREGLLAPGLARRLAARSAVLVIATFTVYLVEPVSYLFILVPPMVWLTFGGGFIGAPLGAFLVMMIAFPLTYLGIAAPTLFSGAVDVRQQFFILQLFLGMMLLITLPVGMILDHRLRLIARLRLREAELLYLSEHDPLTEVLNRRGLERAFQQAVEDSLAISLIVFDVDWFKSYNDHYGHPEGDQCLRWLAGIARERAERAGGYAGRMGGEEFGVLLPDMPPAQARQWAEELLEAIRQGRRPHEKSPLGIVSISAGIASRTRGGRSEDRSIFLEADAALYAAKRSGRNTIGTYQYARPDEAKGAEGATAPG